MTRTIIILLFVTNTLISQSNYLNCSDLRTIITTLISTDSIPVVKIYNTNYQILVDKTILLDFNCSKDFKKHVRRFSDENFRLTRSDLTFIDQQFKVQQICELDSSELKLFLRPLTDVKRYNQNYYTISTPILFNNLTMCYVRVEYQCTLCGQGTGYILKRVNNKWTIYTRFNEWIS